MYYIQIVCTHPFAIEPIHPIGLGAIIELKGLCFNPCPLFGSYQCLCESVDIAALCMADGQIRPVTLRHNATDTYTGHEQGSII